MMKATHTLSGAIMAQGYLAWLDLPLDPAYITNPKALAIAIPAVAASLVGSTFPDIDIRLKLFGHRTVTHWFPPFLLAAIIGWIFFIPSLFLFSGAALLHIFLDAFTKMGVPVFSPFGTRYGFRLIATGGASEMFVILALMFSGAGIFHFA
jgi:membrane-bound metal-dependent hydrolase YbcI (DUF457 family)